MDCHFKELVSTNLWMKEHVGELENFSKVTADFQTAGRGQRGNGWESAPGENLLMSVYYIPESLKASEQFGISKTVSVAIAGVVREILPDKARVCIKWPNDIYVEDKKVCGILIENILAQDATISGSVIGIGLNLNQLKFDSGAPNPASLRLFLPVGSSRLDSKLVGERIVAEFRKLSKLTGEAIDILYKKQLRGMGEYLRYAVLTPSASPAPTALTQGDGHEIIEATIEDVASDGRLDMLLRDGSRRSFYFKEITPLINS